MLLLTVPLALGILAGVLALAAHLEQRKTRVLMRLTVRSNATPEMAEALVAAELEPFLRAQGLDSRSSAA